MFDLSLTDTYLIAMFVSLAALVPEGIFLLSVITHADTMRLGKEVGNQGVPVGMWLILALGATTVALLLVSVCLYLLS